MTYSSCPINYEYDRCSSKEYGQTCVTCVHWSPIEIVKARVKEIVEAIDTVSKHYAVEINGITHQDDKMSRDYQDVNHLVDAYLREWYKSNPNVRIK